MTTVSKTSEKRGNFGAVLRHPTFNVLLGSEAISLIGDRLVAVALVMLVYDLTQSAASVSTLMMLKAIPALLLGSVAGTLVDRLNRKWVMVASNLAQGLLILVIPFADSLRMVYAVYLLMSIVNQLFIPARASTIPDLVPEKQLITANSLFSMAYVGASSFLAMGLAGFAAEWGGGRSRYRWSGGCGDGGGGDGVDEGVMGLFKGTVPRRYAASCRCDALGREVW